MDDGFAENRADQPVVAVERLTRQHRRGSELVFALHCVTFAVDAGSFVAVVGPSGSGKSTLLHLIGGLDQPTEGRVLFEGRDLSRLPERDLALLRRRRIGFMFQFFNLLPNLPTWQNIALPLLIDSVPADTARKRADALAERLGIAHRLSVPANRLSGGEMQRVALARALVADPVLLLADEPTGNLDTRTGRQIIELLRELTQDGRTSAVMVTHDLTAAAAADRVIHIADGRMAGDAPRLDP